MTGSHFVLQSLRPFYDQRYEVRLKEEVRHGARNRWSAEINWSVKRPLRSLSHPSQITAFCTPQKMGGLFSGEAETTENLGPGTCGGWVKQSLPCQRAPGAQLLSPREKRNALREKPQKVPPQRKPICSPVVLQ